MTTATRITKHRAPATRRERHDRCPICGYAGAWEWVRSYRDAHGLVEVWKCPVYGHERRWAVGP